MSVLVAVASAWNPRERRNRWRVILACGHSAWIRASRRPRLVRCHNCPSREPR